MTDISRYPAHVFWSDEDEGYIATAPDLPGCSAFGETQKEALAELQDAIAAWIEASRAAGNPIPPPSQPAEEASYSGRVLVRMPKSLHARLVQQAKKEDVSLNQCIVFLLTFATTQRVFQSHTEPREEQCCSKYKIFRILNKYTSNENDLNKVVIVNNNYLRQQQALPYIVGSCEMGYGGSEHI